MSKCTHGNMTAHGKECPWCVIAAIQARIGELKAENAALEEENAKLEAALKAILDDCMIPLNRQPPKTDCYGINGRLLYEAKQVLDERR